MLLKHCVIFQVLFFQTFGYESLYQQLKPIIETEKHFWDFRTRFLLHRSIDYAFSKHMEKNCVSMAGDNSYFAEKFFAEVFPLLPPVVLLDKRNRFKCGALLVVAEDGHELRKILKKLPLLPTHRLWCFVNSNTLNELEEIFKKNPSDFGDANFLLLVRDDYNYTLRIQQPDRILERITFPKKGDRWPAIENYIKTFSGREIKYSTADCDIHMNLEPSVENWGMDWSVFKAIVEGMKLTPKLVELPLHSSSGEMIGKFFNGTWEGGILGNLAQGLADIGFCGIVFESSKFRGRISMSNPIRDACLIYAVPHPKPNSDDWSVIFYSFTPTVHLFVATSIVVFATIVRSVANIDFFQSKSTAGFRSLGYSLNVSWGLVLQGYFPNPCTMGTLRPLLFLWSMFSVLMASSFSSHLVSNFARPPYNPKPKSIEDLVKFGYEAPQNTDPFPLSAVINPDDPYTHKWLNRIYTVNDHEQMVDVLDTKPKQALFGFKYDKDVFVPYTKKVIPERVMKKYETMDNCIATILEGFAFRRGSPFLKPVNDYSNNLWQSGLLQKFGKDALTRISLTNPSLREATNTKQSSSAVEALTVFNLKGIFLVLILGHLISTITLVIEVIYNFELNRCRASAAEKPQYRYIR